MDHEGYNCGFTGVCHRCEKHINGCGSACQALGYVYHNHCFVCSQCGRQLRGENFYYIHRKIYCENDFKKSSHYQNRKQCHKCNNQISNSMLQALGKNYHPECFQCEMCQVSLDGIPFTVDKENRIYCLPDYHRKYSPRCSLCQEPIIPDEDSDETVRIVSMEKDFHPECFRCEDCRVQLQDETGKECYPMDGHLLCRTCNIKRTNPQEFSRV